MTPMTHEVPAPRSTDLAVLQRTIGELNKQITALQRQITALSARVATLEGA